jgi:hypothetical protein
MLFLEDVTVICFVILVDILICYCYDCCCYLHEYHTNKVDNIQKDRRFDGITRVRRSRLTQIYLCVYIHTHTHTRTLTHTHTHTHTHPPPHTHTYVYDDRLHCRIPRKRHHHMHQFRCSLLALIMTFQLIL